MRTRAPRDWRIRARLARSRLIASPRFRRLAARLPGLSAITRSRSRALFDLTAGFAYTQGLRAALESGLLDALADRAATRDELAATLVPDELSDGALDALLTAAIGLGLVVRVNEHYALDDAGVALLNEPGVAAMVRHHALTYRDLADPLALLRGGTQPETAAFWQYAGGRAEAGTTPEGAARYSELMAVTQGFVAREVIDAYPFGRHRHLIDIGGGSGAFALAAATAAPDLHVTVFDLPDVAPLAMERFAAAGLGDRAKSVGGSFHGDALPSDGDVYSLVRVLYDHDDAPALELLTRLRAAMPDGAILLVAEPMAELRGAKRSGAYFALYLAAMRSGRCRTPERIVTMLRAAGFRHARERWVRSPLFTGLVVAHR